MTPKLPVVIPAHNEASNITACLNAFTNQIGAPDFELIVVDNASTDSTAELVAEFAKTHLDLKLVLVSEPNLGRGAARAAGFAAAKGDIILSTDADTQVPPQWVATLYQVLSRPDVEVVTGTCRIIDQKPLINTVFNWLQPKLMLAYHLAMGHYWITGSNFGIKRDTYQRAGGFNPAVRDLEDIDLDRRVAKIARIHRLPTRVAVVTSGKRFAGGLVSELLPYARAYLTRFWFGQGGRFDRA